MYWNNGNIPIHTALIKNINAEIINLLLEFK